MVEVMLGLRRCYPRLVAKAQWRVALHPLSMVGLPTRLPAMLSPVGIASNGLGG